MHKQYVPIAVHMQAQVMTGIVSFPSGRRLSDFLNGDLTGQPNRPCAFLELNAVTIFHADGAKERLETIYINTEAIRMLRTLEKDAARGIGANDGPKQYPFVNKLPVRATMRMPGYEINGYLHCEDIQTASQLLTQELAFLPCTDSRIHDIDGDKWWNAGFVAINRRQVHSLQ